MSSVISAVHLGKKFPSAEALLDLNLEVPEASIFGYIGPNGSGKTTTIKTPVPVPGEREEFAVADRKCTVLSFTREQGFALVFDCAELEPGKPARFQVRLLKANRTIMPSQSQGDSSSAGSWPAFLSPIARTNYRCEFILPESAPELSAASAQGREILVFVEQSLGREQRDFRIEHFRPAESGLHAWEERGVVRPAQ